MWFLIFFRFLITTVICSVYLNQFIIILANTFFNLTDELTSQGIVIRQKLSLQEFLAKNYISAAFRVEKSSGRHRSSIRLEAQLLVESDYPRRLNYATTPYTRINIILSCRLALVAAGIYVKGV